MLLHLCLLAVALAQDGTNGGCACKDYTTLSVCEPNQAPYDPADPCKCLTCRRPECVTCPDPGVNCTNDMRPRLCFDCTNRTCCPKCNPVEQPPPCATNCPAAVLPPCQPGTTVKPCTECPTCSGTCDYTACSDRATLPVCDGQVTREGCCDTCIPPDCTEAQRIDCKQSIANNTVPECKPGEIARFINCCVSCVPPPPANTCTPEQVAAALPSVPECQPGQRAEIIPDRCTKTCREPGTNCAPDTVRDFSMIKPCPEGVRPTFTGCTPDCLIPPPVCAPACLEGEKCVRTFSALANSAFRCVKPELCRTFVVAGIDANANPTDVFTLIVKRHCEDVTRSSNDKCPIYEALLTGSLQCKRTGERKDGDKVYTIVECCHARDPAPTVGRRLLSGETLFGSAVNNPGATSGLEFSAEQNSAAALTGFAGLLGFLFL